MAQDDPREFTAINGEERLVKWALGESDEYGIDSLDTFCEVTATVPEEEWAKYDGEEREFTVTFAAQEGEEAEEFSGVAYRHN
jgi:hypothetical protein